MGLRDRPCAGPTPTPSRASPEQRPKPLVKIGWKKGRLIREGVFKAIGPLAGADSSCTKRSPKGGHPKEIWSDVWRWVIDSLIIYNLLNMVDITSVWLATLERVSHAPSTSSPPSLNLFLNTTNSVASDSHVARASLKNATLMVRLFRSLPAPARPRPRNEHLCSRSSILSFR